MSNKTRRAFVAGSLTTIGCVPGAQADVARGKQLLHLVIPKEYFGMHGMHLCQPSLFRGDIFQPYIDIGQGSFRIWGGDGGWKWIQRGGLGSFDWQRTDNIVSTVRAAGIKEIIYAIGGATPVWASGGQDSLPHTRQYNGYPPTNSSYWIDFISTLARRYKNKISAYEIWNEWDLQSSYRGTPEEMVGWARLAFAAIRTQDPAAKVISPTITGVESRLDGFAEFISRGGGDYCDVIGTHGYYGSNYPETLMPYFQRLLSLTRAAGLSNKPLWSTESGIDRWRDENGKRRNLSVTGDEMPEPRAASYVSRMIMSTWLGGAQRIGFYDMSSPSAMANTLTYWPEHPKLITPSGCSYKFMSQLLTGRVLYNYRLTDGLHVVTILSTRDTARFYCNVYWRNDFTAGTVNIEGSRGAVDIFGRPVAYSDDELLITDSPVFVFFDQLVSST